MKTEKGLWERKALLRDGEWFMVMREGPHKWGQASTSQRWGGAKESERWSQKWGEACKHQGTHKDKGIDARGPLRQEQPAHGNQRKAPGNRKVPTEVKGWVLDMGILHRETLGPTEMSGWE